MLKLRPQDRIEIRLSKDMAPVYRILGIADGQVVLEAGGILRTASYDALNGLHNHGVPVTVLPREAYIRSVKLGSYTRTRSAAQQAA